MPLLKSRKFWLSSAIGVLVLSFSLFEWTDLDLRIQDQFYSPQLRTWILPKGARFPRMVLYHAPKVLLISFGVWLLLSLVFPSTGNARKYLSHRTPREVLFLLVCLALFPAMIGGLKKASGIHCPSELIRYGGEHPYRKLSDGKTRTPGDHGHCFPAGHASGGFGLLSLWFVARSYRGRVRALALSMAAGWSMGIYQMLNGSHFLSHTVVTMLLAWIFTLCMAALFKVPFGAMPVRAGSVAKDSEAPQKGPEKGHQA